MKIDYNNTSAPAGVQPGEYEVTVCAWDTRVSQNGNPCIIMDYEVRQDVQQDFAGSKIRYDNFTFTDNAAWRMSQAAMAAGVPDGYEINSPEDFGRVMYRRSMRVTVIERENNGKKYAAVSSFMPATVPAQQPPLPGAQGQTQQYQQAQPQNYQRPPQQAGQYQQQRYQGQAAAQQYQQRAPQQGSRNARPQPQQAQMPNGFYDAVNDEGLPFN